jgi:hypothetical protein
MLIDCGGVEEADTELRYLKGALSEDEAESFEAHFMGCERCWTALHRAIELSAALPDASADTGSGALRLRWDWGAGAVALLLVVIGTSWAIHAARRHPGPASDAVPLVIQPAQPAPPPQPALTPQSTQNPLPSPDRDAQAARGNGSPAFPPRPRADSAGTGPALAYGRVQSLGVRGDSQIAGRRPDLAFAVLDSARRVADSAGLARERVKVRIALSHADGLRGEPAAAVRWAGGAVRIADSLGDPDAEIEARKAYAAALSANGDVRAGEQYRRVIDLLMHAGRATEARDVAARAGLSVSGDR